MTIRELITRWGFDVDFGPLEKAEAHTKKLRDRFLQVGAVATGALLGIVAPAAAMDSAIRRAASVAGKSGAEFDKTLAKLSGLAMKFAEVTGASATEIGASFFDVISAGIDPLTSAFDDFALVSLKLNKVAGGNASETTEQLNTALKSFGMGADQAGVMADKLAKGNALGATSISQLSAAAKIGFPAAAQIMNQSLDSSIAMLTAFADAGFKGENGGEAYKQVLLALAAPTDRAKSVLKELNIATTDSSGKWRDLIEITEDLGKGLAKLTPASRAAAMEQLFGRETVAKFGSVLGQGTDKLKTFRTALADSTGELDKQEAQMSGLIDAGKKLWQGLLNIVRVFGAPLTEPLTAATNKVKDLVVKFRELMSENPGLVRGLSWAAAALLSLVAAGSAIGLLTTGFKLLQIAAKKAGVELIMMQLKAIALPIALIAAGIALFLLLDDLAAMMVGQKSVIGDLIARYQDWAMTIKSVAVALGLVAFTLGFAFAPVTLLIVLLAVLAAAWIRAGKSLEDFSRINKDADWASITADVLTWVGVIEDAEAAAKALRFEMETFFAAMDKIGTWFRDFFPRHSKDFRVRTEIREVGRVEAAPWGSGAWSVPAANALETVPQMSAVALGGGGSWPFGATRNQSVEQNVTFNITGAQDPRATGDAVRAAMDDVLQTTDETLNGDD